MTGESLFSLQVYNQIYGIDNGRQVIDDVTLRAQVVFYATIIMSSAEHQTLSPEIWDKFLKIEWEDTLDTETKIGDNPSVFDKLRYVLCLAVVQNSSSSSLVNAVRFLLEQINELAEIKAKGKHYHTSLSGYEDFSIDEAGRLTAKIVSTTMDYYSSFNLLSLFSLTGPNRESNIIKGCFFEISEKGQFVIRLIRVK